MNAGFDESCGSSAPDLALTAARATIEQLQQALESNRRIGVAMGILMERHRLTSDAAFATLVRLSHSTNRKLAEIAGELVDTRRLPSVVGSGSGGVIRLPYVAGIPVILPAAGLCPPGRARQQSNHGGARRVDAGRRQPSEIRLWSARHRVRGRALAGGMGRHTLCGLPVGPQPRTASSAPDVIGVGPAVRFRVGAERRGGAATILA